MPQTTYKYFSLTLRKCGGPLGMKLGYCNGNLIVTRFQDIDEKGTKGPAETCNLLQTGDILLEVQGMNIKGFLFNQIVSMIKENDILTFRFSRKVESGLVNLLSNHPVPPWQRKRLRQLPMDFCTKCVFTAFDTDLNGALSREELENTPFGTVFECVFKRMDGNDDGLIDVEEWNNAWLQLREEVGSLKVQNMLCRIVYHCNIDVEDGLKKYGEKDEACDFENIAEIENAMNRSISNILKLKALGNSRIAGVNKKAVHLFAVNSNANIYSEEMRKKRILTLKQDDRLEKLGRLFKLWDFDSNGYLDLLEIKVVMHHFKNSMYPHDYFKKAIMSEYVDNKIGYKGFESDPLVTKKEFPFFFLHLCDAHELEKFNETLTMLHRSIVIVSNTIEADKAFKRISPLQKSLPTSIIKRILKQYFIQPNEEADDYFQYAPAISSINLSLEDVPDSLNRETFKSYIVRQLGNERTLPHIFSEILKKVVDGYTREIEGKLIDKLYTLWDQDSSGYLEAEEIDAVLIRLDFIYDMLYDNETYAVTGDSRNIESHFMEGVDPEGKIINVGVGKTKMRRASLLALKSLGIKRGINGVLTKEQFPVYIKKLCVSFGEGGFTNFIYFMRKVVIEVRRLKSFMNILTIRGFQKAYTNSGFINYFQNVIDSMDQSCMGYGAINMECVKKVFNGNESQTTPAEIANLCLEMIAPLTVDEFKKILVAMELVAKEWAKGNVNNTVKINPMSTISVTNDARVENIEEDPLNGSAPAKGGGCCMLQ